MRYEDEEYRRGDSDVSTKLTYLLIGGGIGAILALLFAPKSGHELRGDLADATRKGIDRGREAAGQLGDRAGEVYGTARERAGEAYGTARERAGEAYNTTRRRAGEYYEATRERAGEIYDTARSRVGETYEAATEKASGATAGAREAAARKQSQVSAAIDAGRKAYEEEKRRTESSALLEGGPKYGDGEVS